MNMDVDEERRVVVPLEVKRDVFTADNLLGKTVAQLTMAQLFQKVINLISKQPSQRDDNEINDLLPWLRKRSDLLKNVKKEVLHVLIKRCMYEKVQKDDVILTQGEHGEKFYIMLTGRTSVYIDTTKSDEEPSLDGKPTTAKPVSPKPQVNQAFLDQLDEEKRQRDEKKHKHKLDRSQFGKFIISYESGKSFGEIALMSKDAIRNASIISDEETDLLVIDRKLFNNTLKASQEAEYRERKAFIMKSPLFRNWTPRFRRLCEMSLRKEIHRFDSVLVKQGDPVVGLHFILKGQAKVLMDTTSHRHQFPKVFECTGENIIAKEIGRQVQKKDEKTNDAVQQEHVRVRRREGYIAAEQRLAQKQTALCFVEESGIIGDTELVVGLDTYVQTVSCTSNTEVLILDNKNIDRLIHRKNVQTLDNLRDRVEKKLIARKGTNVGRQIELYNFILNKIREISRKKANALRKRQEADQQRALEREKIQRPVVNLTDKLNDKDLMRSQLAKLFIQDRIPFIEPSVHGSVYYMTKSAQKAKDYSSSGDLRRRREESATLGPQVKLDRARRAARRVPRSRRELERITLTHQTDEMKQLQHTNHAINRIKNLTSRPNTAHVMTRPPQTPNTPDHSHKTPIPETPSASGERIFELTELQSKDNPDGQWILDERDIEHTEIKDIAMDIKSRIYERNKSRVKIVRSMIEKNTNQPGVATGRLQRSKSAPTNTLQLPLDSDEEEFEDYDDETSDKTLSDLEVKIRNFHEKHDENGKTVVAQIPELKRFTIQNPNDVPIPGGTVVIHQHRCKYPPGSSIDPSEHQHVRRFIIPGDVYEKIATQSAHTIASVRDVRDGVRDNVRDGARDADANSDRSIPKRSPIVRVQSAPHPTRRLIPAATPLVTVAEAW